MHILPVVTKRSKLSRYVLQLSVSMHCDAQVEASFYPAVARPLFVSYENIPMYTCTGYDSSDTDVITAVLESRRLSWGGREG